MLQLVALLEGQQDVDALSIREEAARKIGGGRKGFRLTGCGVPWSPLNLLRNVQFERVK